MAVFEENNAFMELTKKLDRKYSNSVSYDDFDTVMKNPALMQTLENYDRFSFKKNKDNDLEKIATYNDSVKIYLKEIGKYPLLSAAEEKELFKKVMNGDMKARETFIKCNLRLVVSVAKRYLGYGLPLEDLIQEGNLGLIRAIDSFDVNKGYKFSTYSWFWIRQSIGRALADSGKIIRVPVHTLEEIEKLKRIRSNIIMNTEKEPSKINIAEQIAENMGIPIEKVAFLEVVERQMATISINEIISSEDSDAEFECFIPDDKPTPEDLVIESSLREQLFIAFNDVRLTSQEIEVLTFRFGLDGGGIRSLEKVGKKFNLTRERIRQIEFKAIRKLKKPISTRRLIAYSDNESIAAKNVGLDIDNNLKYIGVDDKNRKLRRKTVYEHFDSTPEKVESVVSKLDEEEQQLFGVIKQNYLTGRKFDRGEYAMFYKKLRPKILQKLNAEISESSGIEETKKLVKLP